MNDYWAKAMVFARSARLLQASGDPDSAISRAYYAMYDAARAALELVDPKLSISKRHDTIIKRFGEHIVVGRQLDKRLSRILNSGEDSRLFADMRVDLLRLTKPAGSLTTWTSFWLQSRKYSRKPIHDLLRPLFLRDQTASKRRDRHHLGGEAMTEGTIRIGLPLLLDALKSRYGSRLSGVYSIDLREQYDEHEQSENWVAVVLDDSAWTPIDEDMALADIEADILLQSGHDFYAVPISRAEWERPVPRHSDISRDVRDKAQPLMALAAA